MSTNQSSLSLGQSSLVVLQYRRGSVVRYCSEIKSFCKMEVIIFLRLLMVDINHYYFDNLQS